MDFAQVGITPAPLAKFLGDNTGMIYCILTLTVSSGHWKYVIQGQGHLYPFVFCLLPCCISGVGLMKVDQFSKELFVQTRSIFKCTRFKILISRLRSRSFLLDRFLFPAMLCDWCNFGESASNCSRFMTWTMLISRSSDFKVEVKIKVIHIE